MYKQIAKQNVHILNLKSMNRVLHCFRVKEEREGRGERKAKIIIILLLEVITLVARDTHLLCKIRYRVEIAWARARYEVIIREKRSAAASASAKR